MSRDPLLALACDLVAEVLRFDAPADAIVSRFFREHRALGPRERHALAETVYELLRRRLLFEHLARSGPGVLARRLALLAWQGGSGVRDAAATPAERTWLDDVSKIDRAALPEPLQHNLPDWLAAPLERTLGSEFDALAASLLQPAPLDLRANLLKGRRDDLQSVLRAEGIESTPTPHSPWGLRVEGKPAVTRLEAFAGGRFEVQDEGSQLLALVTDPKRGDMVADFCAGAGGKTLALGAVMRNTGRLYAFDTSAHRLDALKPRLARSGLSNVYPAQIAHERDERIRRMTGKLDRVLVDAPCSGVGTLRRNPDLKWRQTAATVDELSGRQAAILEGGSRLVKPGGRLVYATCSLLESENEAIATAFGQAHAEFRTVPAQDALARAHVDNPAELVSGPFLRLWPHRHGTDGFFAAIWQRSA